MRVMHVISGALGRGAEIFAADLSAELARREVEQIVVGIHGVPHDRVAFRIPGCVTRPAGVAVPGLRVDVGKVRQVRGIADSWRADLVQAHGGEALKHCLAVPFGIPVVYRRIGMSPRWIRREPRRSAYAFLMRRAARVVAVARAVGQESIDRFGVPAARVVDIPNGVDVSRLRPSTSSDRIRSILDIDDSAPVVVWVGALTWEKDPIAAIDVMASAVARVPHAVQLLVGDGPLRGEVEHAIRVRGMSRNVRVLGWWSNVADLLSASDILLFTSRDHGMEGMPAAVIEAGMLGLPVAGYRVAGVTEVVLNGSTGALAAPRDLARLEDNVVRLMTSARLRGQLGDAARDRCRDLFGIERVGSMYDQTYREVLAW